MTKRLVVSIAIVLLAGCSAYSAQKSSANVEESFSRSESTAPAGDEAILSEFQTRPTGIKQATIISELDIYKLDLSSQGKYNCCVEPSCNECAINHGECVCRIAIREGGPCCGECTGAWLDGRGTVPGLDKEDILRNLGESANLYTRGSEATEEQEKKKDESEHEHPQH